MGNSSATFYFSLQSLRFPTLVVYLHLKKEVLLFFLLCFFFYWNSKSSPLKRGGTENDDKRDQSVRLTGFWWCDQPLQNSAKKRGGNKMENVTVEQQQRRLWKTYRSRSCWQKEKRNTRREQVKEPAMFFSFSCRLNLAGSNLRSSFVLSPPQHTQPRGIEIPINCINRFLDGNLGVSES